MQPIYRSDGEWVAVYDSGNLFNSDGEWVGFARGRDIYDTSGLYMGFLSDDRRLLRKRNPPDKPRLKVPNRPERPTLPANMPLSPMLRALPHHYVDMFEEYPDRLSYISDTRSDME